MINTGKMDTITTVLNNLKRKKQDNEFLLNEHGLVSLNGKLYHRDEIKMIRTYRFEGQSDPADQAIIYLIETNDGATGYSLDAYGAYTNHANDAYAELIRQMAV